MERYKKKVEAIKPYNDSAWDILYSKLQSEVRDFRIGENSTDSGPHLWTNQDAGMTEQLGQWAIQTNIDYDLIKDCVMWSADNPDVWYDRYIKYSLEDIQHLSLTKIFPIFIKIFKETDNRIDFEQGIVKQINKGHDEDIKVSDLIFEYTYVTKGMYILITEKK